MEISKIDKMKRTQHRVIMVGAG